MENYDSSTDISFAEQQLQECISNRQNAYLVELGGWQEQLDMIFHDFDGWKTKVQEIKSRYPKPSLGA